MVVARCWDGRGLGSYYLRSTVLVLKDEFWRWVGVPNCLNSLQHVINVWIKPPSKRSHCRANKKVTLSSPSLFACFLQSHLQRQQEKLVNSWGREMSFTHPIFGTGRNSHYDSVCVPQDRCDLKILSWLGAP